MIMMADWDREISTNLSSCSGMQEVSHSVITPMGLPLVASHWLMERTDRGGSQWQPPSYLFLVEWNLCQVLGKGLDWREGRIVVVVAEKNDQFQQPSASSPPPSHLPLGNIARRPHHSGYQCCRAKKINQDGTFFRGPFMHVIPKKQNVHPFVCSCICLKRVAMVYILYSAASHTQRGV